MAVLVEAISVVIRLAALEENDVEWGEPYPTYCADGALARVGFMDPVDAQSCIEFLEKNGLVHLRRGRAVDFVVADQVTGLYTPCDWLEFRDIYLDEQCTQPVAVCKVAAAPEDLLAAPDGWQYEGSLSQSFGFTPNEQMDKTMQYLRHENGVDVYHCLLTGKEVYIGRAGADA